MPRHPERGVAKIIRWALMENPEPNTTQQDVVLSFAWNRTREKGTGKQS